MTRKYQRPNLNAPRYRPKKLNLTNIDFYNQFLKDNPKHIGLTLTQFKDIIKTFNGKIWQTAVEKRDGVELPEQLGFIFIGTCPRKKNDNPDFKKSEHYGVRIQNQNWESDQFVAKIFYTNFETKYRFKNHELWGFSGLRDFKRTIAKTYPKEWKKYVQVDNLVKVSRLFRMMKSKHKAEDETKEMLKYYDEFNLD